MKIAKALLVAQGALADRQGPKDREASQAIDRLKPVLGHIEDAKRLMDRLNNVLEREA